MIRNVAPLQRLRCGLKDSLLHMAILIRAANDETNVLALFKRITALENEAFFLGLDKRKASGNTREDGSHSAPHDIVKRRNERKPLLIKRWVFGNSKNGFWRSASSQFAKDINR